MYKQIKYRYGEKNKMLKDGYLVCFRNIHCNSCIKRYRKNYKLEEVKEENKGRRPKANEEYFYVYISHGELGVGATIYFKNSREDINRLELGNYFSQRAEAERVRGQIKKLL